MRIDVKRFYMPGFVIRAVCPICEREVTMNLDGDYLSYPETGEQDVRMYCEDEDGEMESHEFKVRVRLSVVLDAVSGCTVDRPPEDGGTVTAR